MNTWHKYQNFKKQKNDDGTFTYFISVDGVEVEVSKAVYKEYASASRKMKYMELDLKRDRVQQGADGKAVVDENGNSVTLPEREISLEKLIDEDWDYASSEPTPEDATIEQFEIKALYSGLSLLDDDERTLINALFFDGLTIREYAEFTGKSKSSIDRQKTKILNKLKSFLTN